MTQTTPLPPAPPTAPAPVPLPEPEPGPPLRPEDARNWAVGAHLSGFAAAWFALGFLGPLTVLFTAGRRDAFVRRHAVEALNFNLSVLLWAAVSAVLVLVLVGIPMLLAVGVLYLVSTVLGAQAASRGEEFRYPLTLRLVS